MIKPTLILACSGGFADEAMYSSYAAGQVCAVIGAFVTLALAYDCCRQRRITAPLMISALLLAIHPAWTVPAMRGDCSTPRIPASYGATVIFITLVLVHYLFMRRLGRRSEQRSH